MLVVLGVPLVSQVSVYAVRDRQTDRQVNGRQIKDVIKSLDRISTLHFLHTSSVPHNLNGHLPKQAEEKPMVTSKPGFPDGKQPSQNM